MDLFVVQGVLALALYYRHSEDHRSFVTYAREGLRKAQDQGLHQPGTALSDGSLLSNEDVIHERAKLFWLAFALCQEASLFFKGTLEALLPEYTTPENFPPNPIRYSSCEVDFSYSFIELARIQWKVQDLLYTAKAGRETQRQLIENVRKCEHELDPWPAPEVPSPSDDDDTLGWLAFQESLRMHIALLSCYVGLFRVCQVIRESSPAYTNRLDIVNFKSRAVNSIRGMLDVVAINGFRTQRTAFVRGIIWFFPAAVFHLCKHNHQQPWRGENNR